MEHLDLIEYVIVDLLKVKWNSFVKRTFYTQFLIFFLFFLLSSGCFVMRETTPQISEECQESEEDNNTTSIMSNVTSNMTSLVQRFKREDFLQVNTGDQYLALHFQFKFCKDLINSTESFRSSGNTVQQNDAVGVADVTSFADLEMNLLNDTVVNGTDLCAAQEEELVCYRHTYDTVEKQIRLGMEVALTIWSILYLVKAGHEYTFLGKRIWVDNMKMCPSRLLNRVNILMPCDYTVSSSPNLGRETCSI